jgi:BirA family biotin operon repressor/biotin-[acetyl-CoA-carboxylase] ligase
LAKILRNLLVELSTWESGRDMTSAYRKMNATLGKAVRIELPGGESIEAIAQDIDSTGALHLNSGQIITVGDVIHLDSKLS